MQIEVQIKMGNVHMLKKDWQLAIFTFNSCKGKVKAPRFFMNFADCYQQLDQFDFALENLNEAVASFEARNEVGCPGEFAKCLFIRGQIHQRKLNLKVNLIRKLLRILPRLLG